MIRKILIGFTPWPIYRRVRATSNHLRGSCVRPLPSVDEMENRTISAPAWDRIPGSRSSSTVVAELSSVLCEYKNTHCVKFSYVFSLQTSRNKSPQLKVAFIRIRRTACGLPALWYDSITSVTTDSLNSTLSIFPRELLYINPIEFFTVTKHF